MPFYLWMIIIVFVVLFLQIDLILNYIKKIYKRIIFSLRIKITQIKYYIKSSYYYRKIFCFVKIKTIQLPFNIKKIEYIQLFNNLKNNPSFFCLFLVSFAILIFFHNSSTHPIVYVMTLSIYFAFTAVMFKLLNKNIVRVIAFIIVCIIFYSRFQPISKFPNTKDLGGGILTVNVGEYIEQDFWLPESDWRLNRLLKRPDIEAIIRTKGIINLENSYLYVNDKYIGELSSLHANEYWTPLPDTTNTAQNYLFKFPKDLLRNSKKVSIRIASKKEFRIEYTSGIHPLPLSPHSRLVRADGSVEDLSERYYNRRFRFGNVIYLYSNKYLGKDSPFLKTPLILGSII